MSDNTLSGQAVSSKADSQQLLNQVRKWLRSRFMDGKENVPLNADGSVALVHLDFRGFHAYLDGIGADTPEMVSECRRRRWIVQIDQQNMETGKHTRSYGITPMVMEAAETPGEAAVPAEANGQLAADDGDGMEDFHELRQFAVSKLKGIERRIVELICEHAGACPLADLAIDSAIKWATPYDGAFNSRRIAINAKLKASQLTWRIKRENNAAKAYHVVRK